MMLKSLLSLMIVATMTCETVLNNLTTTIKRCENNEVVCYMNVYNGGISCKFKEIE